MDEIKGKPQLIFFKTREEYESRPNYVVHIDAKTNKPLELIGKYSFTKEKEVPCGLCNTKHQYGFVGFFDSGDETNVGKDCGLKHFDAKWSEITAVFKKRELEEARLDVISSFLSQKAKIEQEVKPLLERIELKAPKILAVIKDLEREPMLINKLHKAIKAQGKIQIEVALSEAAKEASGGKSSFQIQTLETLEGCSVVGQANSICNTIRVLIIHPLYGASESSLNALTEKELQKKTKWISNIFDLVRNAIEFDTSADRFLSVTNLRKLQYFGHGEKRLNNRTRSILKKYGSL